MGIVLITPSLGLADLEEYDRIGTLVILLVTIVIANKFFPINKNIFNLQIDYKFLFILFLLGIILFILTVSIASLLGFNFNHKLYNNTTAIYLDILSFIILAPFIEEVFFRGIIFYNLLKRYSFWISAVYSSILFSISHISFYMLIPAFIIGIVLSWILKKKMNIIYCIVAHAIINLLNILILKM